LRQLITTTNANGVISRYGYCDCGALTYVTNAFGTTLPEVTQYVYDSQSRRTQTYLPYGTAITYTYDSLGRKTVTSDAMGSATNYYDNLNRWIAVSNAFGQVQGAGYDVADRATQSTDANGVTVTNTYDNLGRLLTRTYPDTGSETFTYTSRGLTNYVNQLYK